MAPEQDRRFFFHDLLILSLRLKLRLARKEKEEVLSSDRIVDLPADSGAAKKEKVKNQVSSSESVFSAMALPCSFYRSFLKANSVKALSLGNLYFNSTIIFAFWVIA